MNNLKRSIFHLQQSIRFEHPDDQDLLNALDILVKKIMVSESNLKDGDTCPHCRRGALNVIGANEPYHDEYFQCDHCDSTFVKEGNCAIHNLDATGKCFKCGRQIEPLLNLDT